MIFYPPIFCGVCISTHNISEIREAKATFRVYSVVFRVYSVISGQGLVTERTGKTIRAAIYSRLSKDDELQGESASISNQRDMLTEYCKSNGWQIVGVYQEM